MNGKQYLEFNGNYWFHETAHIETQDIGQGTKIWHEAHLRENSKAGKDCIIGKGVYIDTKVIIGDRCKIQNYACIYQGVKIGDDVFVGPHCCFTNDSIPRAFGTFEPEITIVKNGASIGANSTIRCGITIGEYAMIGAGAVVTHDVPDYTLVVGVPARIIGKINKEGILIGSVI